MSKKIILSAVGIVAALMAAFVLYVTNLDWNSHKNELATRFSKTLGKKIVFTGDLSVSLLPQPHLSAKDVQILNPQTSEKLAAVDVLETALSLRALLQGVPDISSMSLVGAEFWYTVDENGVSNWHQQQKSQLLDADIEMHMQTFALQNSLVHYQNRKYEINIDLTQLNAEVQATSLVGPYRIDGNFKKGDDHYGIAINIGEVSQGDDIRVNLAVTHPRSESFMRYDGSYNFDTGAFKGDFSGDSNKPADFVNMVSGKQLVDTAYNQSLLFSVGAAADNQALTLNRLAIKFGQLLEGSGDIKVPFTTAEGEKPTIDVRYQMVNADIRPLAQFLYDEFMRYKASDKKYEPHFDYNINYDLAAEKVIVSDAAGGYFENVSAKGSWFNNAFSLDDFYAGCPGNIVLTMSGSLVAENQAPYYFAKVNLDGKNFLTFINALGVKLTAPTPAAYRDIKLAFTLSGTNSAMASEAFNLQMDKAIWEAAAQVNMLEGNRNIYQLKVRADKANLDNYIAYDDKISGWRENLQDDFARLGFLQDQSVQLDFSADSVLYKGITYNKPELKVQTDGKQLKIENAKVDDVMGAKIAVNAVIEGLGTTELTIDELGYDLSVVNMTPLIAKLQLDLPQWKLFSDKPLQSSGKLNGNLQQVEINAASSVQDMHFNYTGKLTQEKYFDFDGQILLKTTNVASLVNNLGGQWKRAGNVSALNCSGHLQGNSRNWQFNEAECVLGTAQYTGNLSVERNRGEYSLTADVEVTDFDLANVLDVQSTKNKKEGTAVFDDDFLARPSFNRSLISYEIYRDLYMSIQLKARRAFYNEEVFDDVSAHVINAQNVLRLQDLHFVYKDADYAGKLQVDYSQQPQLSGALTIRNYELPALGGKIYKITKGTADAETEFTGAATSVEDFVNSLTGTLNLTISNLAVNGFDFGAISNDLAVRQYSKGLFQVVHDNLQSGDSNFKTFVGQIEMKNGTLDFRQAMLENSDVTVMMSGRDSLTDWQMGNEFIVNLKKNTRLPPFQFSLSGSMNKPALEINIEDIVRLYDEHWEKIEAEEQKKREAEKQALNMAMNVVQKSVVGLVQRVHKLQAQLEEAAGKTDEMESVNWYDTQIEKLGEIGGRLDEMQAVARQTDFTLEDVEKIKEECQQYDEQLDAIRQQMPARHEADVKARLASSDALIKKAKADNSAVYDRYQQLLQQKFAELSKLDATSYMLNDYNIQTTQRQIDDLRDQFMEKGYLLTEEYEQVRGIEEIKRLESAVVSLRVHIAQAQALTAQMENLRSVLSRRLESILQEQQDELAEAQEKAEQKRQAAQQEADLLAADEAAAAEEIPEEEEPTDENTDLLAEAPNPVAPQSTLQPVAAGMEAGKVSGTITKAYDDTPAAVQPVSTGLLRPIDGTTVETSGKITVK